MNFRLNIVHTVLLLFLFSTRFPMTCVKFKLFIFIREKNELPNIITIVP